MAKSKTEEVITEEIIEVITEEIVLNVPISEIDSPGHHSRDFKDKK